MSTNNAFFPFIIGYNGEKALIDKRLKGIYQRQALAKLLESSQYKLAFCYAVQNGTEAMQQVADSYNATSGSKYSVNDLERLFGVFGMNLTKKIVHI
jgi:hypothetical protein